MYIHVHVQKSSSLSYRYNQTKCGASWWHTASLSTPDKCPTKSIIYCLAKEELSLTTKYESLLDLAMHLGCDYLKELEVGGNAHYRSHAIISEFLTLIATVIEDGQLSELAHSKFYSLLTDESTDIFVKKQLVLVAWYLKGTEVKTAHRRRY